MGMARSLELPSGGGEAAVDLGGEGEEGGEWPVVDAYLGDAVVVVGLHDGDAGDGVSKGVLGPLQERSVGRVVAIAELEIVVDRSVGLHRWPHSVLADDCRRH